MLQVKPVAIIPPYPGIMLKYLVNGQIIRSDMYKPQHKKYTLVLITLNILLESVSETCTHRKTRYGENTHRLTVFGCYVDLTSFVMSE